MRRTETSTLAFLDVMACGLGAVILILVVLKQQAPPDTPPQPEPIVSAEQAEADLDNLQNELATLLAAQDTAKGDLAKQQQRQQNLSDLLCPPKRCSEAADFHYIVFE